MIDNRFILELPDSLVKEFDHPKLIELYDQHMTTKNIVTRLKSSDFEYLESLRTKFPFLSSTVAFLKLYKEKPTSIHIDYTLKTKDIRRCSLNLCMGPYGECSNAVTAFFEESRVKAIDNTLGLTYYEEGAPPIYQYRLARPALVNVRIPHSVILDEGALPRRTISWSIDVDFFEAKALILQYDKQAQEKAQAQS